MPFGLRVGVRHRGFDQRLRLRAPGGEKRFVAVDREISDRNVIGLYLFEIFKFKP